VFILGTKFAFMIEEKKFAIGLGEYLDQRIGEEEFGRILSDGWQKNQAEIDRIRFVTGLRFGNGGVMESGRLDEEFMVMRIKDCEKLKSDRERYDTARKEFYKERNWLLEKLREVAPEEAKAFE
jgi:hypothetical protein